MGAETRTQQANSSFLLQKYLLINARVPFLLCQEWQAYHFLFSYVLIIAPLRVRFISQPSRLSGLIFIQYKCSHYKDLTWGEYKWEDECTLRTCLHRNCIDQRNSRAEPMSALTCSYFQGSNSFLSHRNGVTPCLWNQANVMILFYWNKKCKAFLLNIMVRH